MKTITHTVRMSQPLHIEAPGCIVNIHAGLEDAEGNPVTSVQVLCDSYLGNAWRLENGEKFAGLRVTKRVS
jgi:hypothetical protein